MSWSEIWDKGFLGNFIIDSVKKGAPSVLCLAGGFVAVAVVAYFIGSFNFGIIISRKRFRDDVRAHGSGNAGMTNMLRTYGKKAGIITFLGDFFKSVFCVFIGISVLGADCGYVAGLFCIIGHAYPVFFEFKGGKGVAVVAGMIITLSPLVFAILFALFLIIVLFSKYVSLGSVVCMALYPILLNRIEGASAGNLVAFIVAALIIYFHRANIKRLGEGTEAKLSLHGHGGGNE